MSDERAPLKSHIEWTLIKHLGSPFPYPARDGLISGLADVADAHAEYARDALEAEWRQRTAELTASAVPGIVVTTAFGAEAHYDAPRWEDVNGYLHIFDRKAVRIATYAPGSWAAVAAEGAASPTPDIRFEERPYCVAVWHGARLLAVYGAMPDGLNRYESVADWEAANE